MGASLTAGFCTVVTLLLDGLERLHGLLVQVLVDLQQRRAEWTLHNDVSQCVAWSDW